MKPYFLTYTKNGNKHTVIYRAETKNELRHKIINTHDHSIPFELYYLDNKGKRIYIQQNKN